VLLVANNSKCTTHLKLTHDNAFCKATNKAVDVGMFALASR